MTNGKFQDGEIYQRHSECKMDKCLYRDLIRSYESTIMPKIPDNAKFLVRYWTIVNATNISCTVANCKLGNILGNTLAEVTIGSPFGIHYRYWLIVRQSTVPVPKLDMSIAKNLHDEMS
jgi:hypothetical protein